MLLVPGSLCPRAFPALAPVQICHLVVNGCHVFCSFWRKKLVHLPHKNLHSLVWYKHFYITYNITLFYCMLQYTTLLQYYLILLYATVYYFTTIIP